MRIIGGKYGGQVLKPSMTNWPTRPTTDIAREALYNILANRIDFENVVFLDLFGGTGAHTLEFLSRGCRDATFVDQYGKCVLWMKSAINELGEEEHCRVVKMDVSKFIKRCENLYDVIFADPPYSLSWLPTIPDQILDKGILRENGSLIVEHGSEYSFEYHVRCYESRKYGQSRFSFFR